MTQTSASSRMSRGSVARLLLQFSLPATLGMVASALYNIVDRLFIGRFTGADGLAAVGLTFPLTVFVIAAGSLVGVGAASMISRFLGEGRTRAAERALGNALAVMTVFSVLFALLALNRLDGLVRALGATSALFAQTRVYTKILLWGLPFNLLAFAMNAMIRAEGFPRVAMWSMFIGAAANVFLDWLLIVVLNMGVAGAALGTSVAQIASFFWCALFYLRRRGALRVSSASLRPDRAILAEMLLVGLSPFLMELFYTFSMMLFNNIAAAHGGDLALSAIGIFFCLDNLIYLPVFGIGEGLQPIVGYNFGAHSSERVWRAIHCAMMMSTAYFAVSFVCAQVFTRGMIALFTSGNEPLIALTARAMRIGYIGMPFAAAGIVASSAFLAIGRSGLSLFLNFCRQGLLFLPALLVLPRVMGLDGAWSCFIVVDAGGGLVGALLLWKFWNVFAGEGALEHARQTAFAFNK